MQILYLTVFIVGLAFASLGQIALAFAISWILSGLVISCIYHRQVSHNSWQYRNRAVEFFAYYLMVLSGQGSPLAWAYIHRLHHRYTDTELDPQSPLVVGKIRTMLSNYKIEKFDPRLVKDLIRNKNLMFLHKHYNKLFMVHSILWLVFSFEIFLFLCLLPVFCLFWVGIFNTIAHRKQDTSVQDCSVDMSYPVLFWGENNHRLHHLKPSQTCLGKYDTGYLLTRLFGKNK